MKVKIFVYGILLALFAASAWWFQSSLAREEKQKLHNIEAASPAAELVIAGLGGFRGIAAEAVWFRADRLQDEGRYAELAQLATWLTFLEPHTSEVWAYSAWNLSYNISVMMPSPADRWRWVEAGIKLLRDDGLRLNPIDPVLYRELAWMFLLKLGAGIDTAEPYYRKEWKKQIEEAEKTGDWAKLKLDKKRMDEIDQKYGKLDWTTPYASAIYWAESGLPFAAKAMARRELRQIICQSLLLICREDKSFAKRTLEEMESAFKEFPTSFMHDLIQRHKKIYDL